MRSALRQLQAVQEQRGPILTSRGCLGIHLGGLLALLVLLTACDRLPASLPETDCDSLAQTDAVELLDVDPSYKEARHLIASLYDVDPKAVRGGETENRLRRIRFLEWESRETSYQADYVTKQLVVVIARPPESRTMISSIVECLGAPEAFVNFGAIEFSPGTVALLYPSRGQILRFYSHPDADLSDHTTALQLFSVETTDPGPIDSLQADAFGDPDAWDDYVDPWPPQ